MIVALETTPVLSSRYGKVLGHLTLPAGERRALLFKGGTRVPVCWYDRERKAWVADRDFPLTKLPCYEPL
ncbi:MAG: hypothetical protein RJA36_1430 [Pseudomonadota bacterium]|jgi:hypothetical protein